MAQFNDTRTEDNYLHCDRYAGHESAGVEGHPQFTKFQDPETDLYYFSWLDDDGSVVFRSEGYPSTAARDNGVDSVIRNMDIEERYKVIQLPDGLWYVSLRAGNHQEIARSCGYESEDAANYLTPSGRERRRQERAAAAAALAAASPAADGQADATETSNRQEDNYLACKDYKGHERDAEHPEFARFQHTDGEYYFVMYDDNGDVVWRSEGYPTTGARDNGMQSVIKNRDIPERISEKTMLNNYLYFSLKAGNHQEIARSCPKKPGAVVDNSASLAAAAVGTASAAIAVETPTIEVAAPVVEAAVAAVAVAPAVEIETPPAVEPETPKVEIAAAAVAAAAATLGTSEVAAATEDVSAHYTPTRVKEDKEDDYLHCDEYKNKVVNDKQNNVALFKHSNGQYYFVMYNADGSIKLRSEGFKDAKTRDEELRGVLKHHNDSTMYTNIERSGHVLRILKDKTGREVGRSCLEKVAVAAPVAAAVPPVVPPIVPPTVEAAAAAPVIEEAAAGGFKWWWLLPLLLLALCWFMCNKCNKPEVKVPEVKKEAPAPTPAPVTKTSIKSLLPVTLYFDNDQPDARTKATTTTKSYSAAYDAYYALRSEFSAKGDGTATGNFFENDVKKGMDDLKKLAAGLKDIVASGEKANIKIKGFASPLAKSDYNKALTGRRVSSVENYLKAYDASIAKAMTDGTLKISFEENGKDKAAGGVDNIKDKRGSIYGVDASKERRVEIVGVE